MVLLSRAGDRANFRKSGGGKWSAFQDSWGAKGAFLEHPAGHNGNKAQKQEQPQKNPDPPSRWSGFEERDAAEQGAKMAMSGPIEGLRG